MSHRDVEANFNNIYHPLSQVASEIRLIELLPCDDIEDPINCEMKHVSLAKPPSYVALSYCWGDQFQRREIRVNSSAVSVTINLVSALNQMRAFGFSSLWVDALCINQEDREERSAQVMRMSAIYKEASAVVIWLGTSSNGSDKVMKMLDRLEEGAQLPLLHHERPGMTVARNHLATWADLNHFLARPYWTRLWIIQEVAAASRVILVCGTQAVEWERMEYLLQSLALVLGNAYQEHSLLQNLYKTRIDRLDSRPISMLDCLSRSQASQSTNSRDKVFGLLGLAFDRSHFITEPNYRLSESALCQTMTESVIISKRSLDIILLRQQDPVLQDLPTWCPDYLHLATRPFNDTVLSYINGTTTRYRLGVMRARWNSTNSSYATRTTIQFQNNILYCRGWQLGTINGLTRLVEDYSTPYPLSDPHLDRDADPNDSTPFDAVCRMLLIYGMRKSYTDLPALLLALWTPTNHLLTRWTQHDGEYVKRWLEANASFMLRGRRLRDWVVSWRTISNSNGYAGFSRVYEVAKKAFAVFDTQRMTTVATVLRESMRLMTMTDDHVGWAHPGARLEDKVFLLQGCSMPVILRHVPGDERGFHMVGHAYVDRVMEGEVWGSIDPRRLMDVYIC